VKQHFQFLFNWPHYLQLVQVGHVPYKNNFGGDRSPFSTGQMPFLYIAQPKITMQKTQKHKHRMYCLELTTAKVILNVLPLNWLVFTSYLCQIIHAYSRIVTWNGKKKPVACAAWSEAFPLSSSECNDGIISYSSTLAPSSYCILPGLGRGGALTTTNMHSLGTSTTDGSTETAGMDPLKNWTLRKWAMKWTWNLNSAKSFVQCTYQPSFINRSEVIVLTNTQTNKQKSRCCWKHPRRFTMLLRRWKICKLTQV